MFVGVYYIVRELHVWEPSFSNKEQIEELVDCIAPE